MSCCVSCEQIFQHQNVPALRVHQVTTLPYTIHMTYVCHYNYLQAVKPWLGAIVEPSPAPAKGSAAAAAANERLATAAAAVAALQAQLQDSSSASISASLKNALQEASAAADVVQRGTQSDAPSANDLELEWVHGYRAQDCRNNAVYSASGAVVYHAAAVGIALIRDGKSSSAKQQFNTVHTDDVLSLALHPEGRLLATGQMVSHCD
jgi:HELP motif